MWPFSTSQSLAGSGLLHGFTDCHCHLLPGVDDGVRTLQESLTFLSRYESLGIREVWLTPHVMEDVPNTPSFLRQRFAELCAAYHGTVQLHLAAENMLDALFSERLKKGDVLPWGVDADRLLVETSTFSAASNFWDVMQNILSAGYFPILAHPERYHYMEMYTYRELRSMGVEMQLNLFSLLGLYGKRVQHTAERLLGDGYYKYIGSDLHSLETLEWALGRKLDKTLLKEVKNLLNVK